MKRALLAVTMWLTAANAFAASSSYSVAVSSDPVSRVDTSSLSCNDTIYAFLQLPGKASGKHTLEGRWYKPNGKQQEYTHVPLELEAPGQELMYLWLSFERASDAVDVLFAHPEDDDLDGRWTLDIFWDGEKVATRQFQLRCA